METFERINQLLKINKLSKKEFSKKLLALEPKLKNTGEIPSENTIYAYLNGRIGIKIELIPYIAEVLKVPEQLLFDDSEITRKMYLKHILAIRKLNLNYLYFFQIFYLDYFVNVILYILVLHL